MALDVASPLLCSIEGGICFHRTKQIPVILPSGVTHRIFWDISSQLNADDAVSRGRTLPCMCGSGVSPRRSPCLPRSASSSSETPSPWAFHHRYDRCCVPAVPPCMSEFGTSSDTWCWWWSTAGNGGKWSWRETVPLKRSRRRVW